MHGLPREGENFLWVEGQKNFSDCIYNMNMVTKIDYDVDPCDKITNFLVFVFPGLGREMVGRYATIEDAYRAAEDIVTFGDGCKIWNL